MGILLHYFLGMFCVISCFYRALGFAKQALRMLQALLRTAGATILIAGAELQSSTEFNY